MGITLREMVLVFLGGGMGSVLRLWMNRAAVLWSIPFPYGTLLVNVLACLVLGLILGAGRERQWISGGTLLFFSVGICGGFSTFSTFSAEVLQLMENGKLAAAALYLGSSVLLGLLAVGAGFLMVRQIV
ncbi:MAG: fluoride efflux transporter CrcB [Chitinophagales bacterium]